GLDRPCAIRVHSNRPICVYSFNTDLILRRLPAGELQPRKVEEALECHIIRTIAVKALPGGVGEPANLISRVAAEEKTRNRRGRVLTGRLAGCGIDPASHHVHPLHGLSSLPPGVGKADAAVDARRVLRK